MYRYCSWKEVGGRVGRVMFHVRFWYEYDGFFWRGERNGLDRVVLSEKPPSLFIGSQ